MTVSPFVQITKNKILNLISITYLINLIPGGVLLLFPLNFMTWTKIKLLIPKKQLDKFLYPQHPVRCNFKGPSECGNSFSLTNLKLNNVNEFEKLYILSTTLHRDRYQKLIKCFSISIRIKKCRTYSMKKNLNQ